MQRYFILILISTFLSAISYGHNANEAFFTIKQYESGYVVRAEFPWTLRNALLEYQPSLEKAKTKSEFESAFNRYISDRLQLLDHSNNLLLVSEIKEIENSGHSHQNTYEIFFSGSNLERINNTVLFELFTDQKNYHEVYLNDEKYKFTTNQTESGFTIKNNIQVGFDNWKSIFLLVAIGLGIGVYIYKKKN